MLRSSQVQAQLLQAQVQVQLAQQLLLLPLLLLLGGAVATAPSLAALLLELPHFSASCYCCQNCSAVDLLLVPLVLLVLLQAQLVMKLLPVVALVSP